MQILERRRSFSLRTCGTCRILSGHVTKIKLAFLFPLTVIIAGPPYPEGHPHCEGHSYREHLPFSGHLIDRPLWVNCPRWGTNRRLWQDQIMPFESPESPESRRLTRFPGKEEHHRQLFQKRDVAEDKDSDGKRQTRFPGSLNHEFTLLTVASLEGHLQERQIKKASGPIPSRLPLTVNSPDGAPHRAPPTKTIERVKPIFVSIIRHENPWITYKPLRNVIRGSQIQAACTRNRSVPTIMVTLKETSTTIRLDDFIKFQHRNLITFLGAYEYESKMIVVSEYMQVSPKQTIAIPYDFEEIHVSAVCSQVSQSKLLQIIY